jgi:hypothetical protein
MDKSKAKKAVAKSKGRKKTAKQKPSAAPPSMAFNAIVNPEIQSAAPALQPHDGYVNPYRELGTVAPTAYTAGNMLAGNNYPQMV